MTKRNCYARTVNEIDGWVLAKSLSANRLEIFKVIKCIMIKFTLRSPGGGQLFTQPILHVRMKAEKVEDA